MKLVNVFSILMIPLSLIGCDGKDNANSSSKSEMVFKLIKIVPTYQENYLGHFLFINRTDENIKFYGWEPPKNGTFTPIPATLHYEVEIDGEWNELDKGLYSGLPEIFTLKPKKRVELIVELGVFDQFENKEEPLKARIKYYGFTSESFVLDWEKDRREGIFASLRKEHVDKVRELLLQSGFKLELIQGEVFFQQFRYSLISIADDYGFEPFQGDLDSLPRIDSDGNVSFSFASSNAGKDYEYQYVCFLYINPTTFSPKRFRENYMQYVQVGTWGKGRSMEFDMGSGILLERGDMLYFEIQYFPLINPSLPDEEASREFFIKMLENLANWLIE